MTGVEYILNSAAWSLGGVVVTLSYQQLIQWNNRRKGRPEFIKFTPMGFVGAFVILMTIITGLFYTSSDIHQGRVNDSNDDRNRQVQAHLLCVDKIEQQNVVVENKRAELNDKVGTASQHIIDVLAYAFNHPLDPTNNKKFGDAIAAEESVAATNKLYRATHKIQNSAMCPTAPGVAKVQPTHAPTPTPTPSPSKS